jgi:hypothetical protein
LNPVRLAHPALANGPALGFLPRALERAVGMPTKRALSPLPKPTCDIVLGIRLARDVFVEAAHEPGQIHQAKTPLGEGCGIGQQDLAPLFVGTFACGREEPDPTIGDLFGAPLLGRIGPDFKHYVQMVAHHRVAHDGDGEELGEEVDAVFDPLTAVIEVPAGVGIVPAQPRPPHAASDAVIAARQAAGGEVFAGAGHGGPTTRTSRMICTSASPRAAVRWLVARSGGWQTQENTPKAGYANLTLIEVYR